MILISKLTNNANKNGNDIIVDALFMKYLKENRAKHHNSEINNFNAKLIKKQSISQYSIAYVCFNDPKSKFNFKDQIYAQSYKIFTNDAITVNGIHISKVICFYILQILFGYSSSKYENSLINTNYDISKLDMPERISSDLLALIKKKLSLNGLLDMKSYSIDIQNLGSLLYYLLLNGVSNENLDQYKDSMNPKSYQILQYVYKNYSNQNQSLNINHLMYQKTNIHNENDFIMLQSLRSIDKNEYNRYLIEQNNNDLLYIASKDIDLTGSKISSGHYSIMKKYICRGIVDKYEKNINITNFQNDFNRFIQKAINILDGRKKIESFKLYIMNTKNNERKIELIFELIYMKEYDDSIILLNSLNPSEEVKNILTDDLHFDSIKDLLKYVNIEQSCKFIKRFQLENLLTLKEKRKIFFKRTFTSQRIAISRDNLLSDSMKKFENQKLQNKIIRIRYESEKGIDEGGLAKDWFINVNEEIIKRNIFVPTPNGTSLTFNNQTENYDLFKFAGQFIASAFLNKKNINIRLTNFIWKQMMNEKIDLEDMKDFDSELYELLKWISENDPEPLMMTFTDADDSELCENGRNIELTEDNKNEFIRLMIEKKLIKQNKKPLEQIKLGFKDTIDLNLVSIFSSIEIKEYIIGKDSINIDDWKKHTKYDIQNEKNYQDFFTIISKWSQEKLQKLLKFSTGSSIVPTQGFKYLESLGGIFTLNFIHDDSERLPESHTCFNRINIPFYETIEKFENKLT